jgi:DNA polymerase-3 subunit beta
MKAEVMQTNLAKAINAVSRVVSTRTTLPVLANILLKANKNKITVSATDLEVAITSTVIGKVEAEGSVTVPARLVSDFVLNNNDPSITLELKDLSLKLKSKHFEANVRGIAADEFPTVPEPPKTTYSSIKVKELADALKKVTIASASDDTRPVLAGVYFKYDGKRLTLAATDSYRLAEKKIALESAVEKKEVIVPTRTLNELARVISAIDEDKKVNIIFDENQIFFSAEGVEVVSRLIEGSFPNYEQIIPAERKIKVKSKLSETLSAIKMSALFAKDAANNIKLSANKEGLIIRSVAKESGDTTSNVSATVTGGETDIAFNARYLIEALGALPGDEVVMEFNDDSSPGVITSEKDKEYIYLAMPLKSEG